LSFTLGFISCVVVFFLRSCVSIYFFFQAEDGIRDDLVTGVQTCALPISLPGICSCRGASSLSAAPALPAAAFEPPAGLLAGARRSEERRVGKECRSRGGAEQ